MDTGWILCCDSSKRCADGKLLCAGGMADRAMQRSPLPERRKILFLPVLSASPDHFVWGEPDITVSDL